MRLQNNQIQEVSRTLFVGSTILYLTTIHFSPSIASISSILLILNAFYFFLFQNNSKLNKQIQLVFFVSFGYAILSTILHGCNFASVIPKLLIRLPLVFLPSILGYVIHNKINLAKHWLFFSLPIFWLATTSVINYCVHYKFLSQMVLESKPVPIYSQVYHIEFSVIVAVVLLGLLIWKIQGKIDELLGTHFFFYVIFGGLFIALHVLSARTGILCFWIGLMVILSKRIKAIGAKYFIWGILGISLLFFVPSVRNRIQNTKEDLTSVVEKKDLNHKSFGQRWEAWRAIVHAGSKSPWFGVGQCNIESSMQASFEELHSELDQENRISPHNQYLQWFIELGIVGLLIQLFQYALLFRGMRKHGTQTMLWSVVLALVFSLNFESLLERQSGVMIIIVSLLFVSHQLHEKESNNERKHEIS